MMRLPKNFLKGSIPPLITPFKGGKVDYDAYAGLVEFQVKQGSHGILVTGTTSEPSTLTIEERNRCVDVAVEAVRGKILIVAATGSQSHAESLVLCLRHSPVPYLPYCWRWPRCGPCNSIKRIKS